MACVVEDRVPLRRGRRLVREYHWALPTRRRRPTVGGGSAGARAAARTRGGSGPRAHAATRARAATGEGIGSGVRARSASAVSRRLTARERTQCRGERATDGRTSSMSRFHDGSPFLGRPARLRPRFFAASIAGGNVTGRGRRRRSAERSMMQIALGDLLHAHTGGRSEERAGRGRIHAGPGDRRSP
jgi:hypothetical protein